MQADEEARKCAAMAVWRPLLATFFLGDDKWSKGEMEEKVSSSSISSFPFTFRSRVFLGGGKKSVGGGRGLLICR